MKIPERIGRFMEHVEPIPECGCWIWAGARTSKNYGWSSKEKRLAHRLSWNLFRGRIPNKYRICHKCDIPFCVNPNHLFLGTASDNAIDARDKGLAFQPKTHCPQGHEYTQENSYIWKSFKWCRICRSTAVKTRNLKRSSGLLSGAG